MFWGVTADSSHVFPTRASKLLLLRTSRGAWRLGALLALISAAVLGASADASAQSATFTPGPTQEFKVPAGVAFVEVTAVGGEGQSGIQCRSVTGSGAGAGGSGALVTATILVSGVKSLLFRFGGGGAGGTGGGGECSLDGGAGGDASEVLSEASAPLVVAGGGGGGGASYGFGEPLFEETTNGGAGASASTGLASGGIGVLRRQSFIQEEGGGGGGGSPNGAGAAGNGESAIAQWSTAATVGEIGAGGAGGGWNGVAGSPFISAGGGGGGGHYGGGGGGTGNVDGGGGGAGASFIDEAAGATGTVTSGTGQPQAITIHYTVIAQQPPVATPQKPSSSPAPETPAKAVIPHRACASLRAITLHVRKHVHLRAHTRIVNTEVLFKGRELARLHGANPIARVSLAGLPKGTYTVTLYVRTSSGKLLKTSAIYRTCTSGRRT